MLDKSYLSSFMGKLDFPPQAQAQLLELYDTLERDGAGKQELDKMTAEYMADNICDPGEYLTAVSELAERIGRSEYSLLMLFWISCARNLPPLYKQMGIDEQVYHDSMMDLRYKLLECLECKGGIAGTFSGGWFRGFIAMYRFAIGRFEYDISNLDSDYIAPDSTVYAKGSPSLVCHIPSSGVPLTDDVRLDSYKRAYVFYRKYFPELFGNGPLIITCSSWLLYPAHRDFLPPHLNILRFMDDFDIVRSREVEGFSNNWRVYGRYAGLPYEQLPEDTALRRAYKEHLIKTGVAGDGYGVIIFDGEKITNRR